MSILDYARKTFPGTFHFVQSEGFRFQSRSQRVHTARGWLPVLGVACGAALFVVASAHQSPLSGGQELAMLRHAAEQGDTGAQIQLGLAYRSGRFGVAADKSEADAWLHRAAQAGDRYAAQLEASGRPTSGSGALTKAFNDFIRIIRQGAFADHSTVGLMEKARDGDALAQYQMAMRYRDGSWGVKADTDEARSWLQRAALGGNQVAMQTLAAAYEKGDLGLPHDEIQAEAWRARAQDKSDSQLSDNAD